jgi:hypothetical protein
MFRYFCGMVIFIKVLNYYSIIDLENFLIWIFFNIFEYLTVILY